MAQIIPFPKPAYHADNEAEPISYNPKGDLQFLEAMKIRQMALFGAPIFSIPYRNLRKLNEADTATYLKSLFFFVKSIHKENSNIRAYQFDVIKGEFFETKLFDDETMNLWTIVVVTGPDTSTKSGASIFGFFGMEPHFQKREDKTELPHDEDENYRLLRSCQHFPSADVNLSECIREVKSELARRARVADE